MHSTKSFCSVARPKHRFVHNLQTSCFVADCNGARNEQAGGAAPELQQERVYDESKDFTGE